MTRGQDFDAIDELPDEGSIPGFSKECGELPVELGRGAIDPINSGLNGMGRVLSSEVFVAVLQADGFNDYACILSSELHQMLKSIAESTALARS
jgi:hypothetical protein